MKLTQDDIGRLCMIDGLEYQYNNAPAADQFVWMIVGFVELYNGVQRIEVAHIESWIKFTVKSSILILKK